MQMGQMGGDDDNRLVDIRSKLERYRLDREENEKVLQNFKSKS